MKKLVLKKVRSKCIAIAMAIAMLVPSTLLAAESPTIDEGVMGGDGDAGVEAVRTLEQQAVPKLGEVVVSATRTERLADDVPSTVTVVPAMRIQEEGARDIKDVFRNEIDVTVRAAPPRFTAAGAATGRAGNEGINIRGLEGNQVLMMVDEIRVPNSFSFGAFASGRGDFLDVNGIKSVEVLRGPASTQYGSDGLAGAVILRTLDPSDLLKPDQQFGGFARAGYAEVDESFTSTVGVAGQSGRWQGLILGSYRDGHEVDNKGGNNARDISRTQPNPLDYDTPYFLGKVIFATNSTNELGLTIETQQRTQTASALSARSMPPLSATAVLDLDSRDRVERDRVSLQHRYTDVSGEWWQRAETQLYWQDAKVTQFSVEDRNLAADRIRDNSYRQKVVGVSTLFETNLSALVDQRLTYGIDWSEADISGVRDGTVPPIGESFPVKPFPDTQYRLVGAFVQSEIELGDLSIIPALRFDHYKLEPSSAGFPSGQVFELSDQAVTPRLGLVWRLAPEFSPYAQYAQGFRAPTPDQVNNGFANPVFGYRSIGNSNLAPEHASSIEIGVRGQINEFRYSLAAYDNRYKDFISQEIVSGTGTPLDPLVFQFINLEKAHIYGLEARSEWRMARRWTLTAGAAFSHGDSEVDGDKTPLDTIEPLKVVAGMRYDEGIWGARLNLTYSKHKEADRIGTVSGATLAPTPQFASPTSAVLDLGLFWKPIQRLTIDANLNNLFDRKYWRWSDVRGLDDNSPITDAYTAPGRNGQLSVRYDF